MKETGLRDKACVVPVAIAASLGMAGMGLVSSGVVAADVASVTDTISVGVLPSCTFNSVEDKTYAGSAANGTEVGDFNDSGVHEFNLFCNDNNGFIVTATPYDLEASGIEDVIEYTDSYDPSGVDSIWSAAIASDSTGVTVVPVVPVGGGTILSSDTSTATAGVDFSATYSAYVGTEMPAGTYTGTIVYTLTASGASSSASSGSGGANQNSGNGGDDENGGDSGTGSGEEGTGNNGGGSGTNAINPNNINSGSSSNTPSNASLMMAPNNSYSTYNTYNTSNNSNTYNTTNYANSGTTATQAVTDDITNDTTSGTNNGSGLEVSDGYEKPLGVTTSTTKSSSEDSGVDVAPVVATGIALAVTGAAAIAVAQGKKEKEKE